MENSYGLKTGFKIFFWIFGILTLPLFLIGLFFVWMIFKAYAKVSDEGLEYWWVTTKRLRWDEIGGLHWARPNGLLGSAMRPLQISRTEGKPVILPIGTFVGEQALIKTLQARTSLDITSWRD
ncbi:MAG: hypothetical protein ACPG4T_03250 [Nannocystaceae bacterium]